jgi:Cu/Ag efflux protein CusF
MIRHHKFPSTTSALLCLCALLAFLPACNHGKQPAPADSQSGAKRYALKGTVVSVDKNAGTANIDNEPVAGFMDKMVMSYPLKPATAVNQLQPGDSITADVVVTGEKYWLENVQVTGHAKPPADKPAASHSAS